MNRTQIVLHLHLLLDIMLLCTVYGPGSKKFVRYNPILVPSALLKGSETISSHCTWLGAFLYELLPFGPVPERECVAVVCCDGCHFGTRRREAACLYRPRPVAMTKLCQLAHGPGVPNDGAGVLAHLEQQTNGSELPCYRVDIINLNQNCCQ